MDHYNLLPDIIKSAKACGTKINNIYIGGKDDSTRESISLSKIISHESFPQELRGKISYFSCDPSQRFHIRNFFPNPSNVYLKIGLPCLDNFQIKLGNSTAKIFLPKYNSYKTSND